MKQQDTGQISVQVSLAHRAKINQIKKSGLKIRTIIEQGIDVVFERMVQAGVVKPLETPCLEEKSTV